LSTSEELASLTGAARDKVFQKDLVTLIPHLRAFARTLTGDATQADDLVDDPESPVALDELRQAMNILPPEQREALILVGAGGFAYEEAADICGCAVGTVKSRVSRARKAVQVILEAGAYGRDGRAAGEAMGSILGEAERLSAASR
jgi:DNA-directed RNA polymerase specialized sigma24 family protein